MSKKSDIVERLEKWIAFGHIPNDMDGRVELMTDVMEALEEIKFLRSHAGAITRGESFDDIARRVGRQPKDPD